MGKARLSGILRTALRIFAYQIAFGFFGFIFTPALMGAGPALRIPVIGLLIAAAGLLMFMDGSYRGEKDCALGETLGKLERQGNYQASDAENAGRFSRARGALAPLLGALPMLVIATIVAAMAEPYAYSLQDLPGWLGSYLGRAEIGEPLAYLQDVLISATAVDYLRVAVRFVLFPYVGLLGAMTDAASLALDRVSPLLTLIMPAAAAIGYQFGPARRAKSVKAIEEAKRKPRKRLKKKTAGREGQPKEKKQLI